MVEALDAAVAMKRRGRRQDGNERIALIEEYAQEFKTGDDLLDSARMWRGREFPLARWQDSVPVVDGVGRPLAVGDSVRSRFETERYGLPMGTIIHLFDFGDFHPPELEFQELHGRLPYGRIHTASSRWTGGCWKFETVLRAS